MIKVKIYGAGSIGNHLAQACRRNDWDVSVADIDVEALKRMKNDIYPKRYGVWDENIKLYEVGQEPKGGFDVIMIGTPPDVRMDMALRILKQEHPRLILLEKPLCSVRDIHKIFEFQKIAADLGVAAVVGYNHALSKSVKRVALLLGAQVIGEIETIDVEWREHWGGIFAAHPWLSGPENSYLGYTARGGGAIGEHSHAIHLWLFLARMSDFGAPAEISCFLDFENNNLKYDKIAALSIRTRKKKQGRIVQDVITRPAKKKVRVQGSKGFIEWECEHDKDLIYFQIFSNPLEKFEFPKIRSDEFFQEIKHIQELTADSAKESSISLNSGIETMKIIEAAQTSNSKGCSIFL